MKTREDIFLSNWCPFDIDGIHYHSTWDANYAYLPTLSLISRKRLFTEVINKTQVYAIMLAKKPYTDIQKHISMRFVLLPEFSNSPYRDHPLHTGNSIIIFDEMIHDPFWGIYDNEGITSLSRLMTDIRSEIRSMSDYETKTTNA